MCQGIFHKTRPRSCLPFLSSCTTPDPAPLPHVRDEKGTSLCGFFPGVSLQGASPLFTTSPTLQATYTETELCRSNKNHNRVISFEGHLVILSTFFASRRRCLLPSLPCPSSPWLSKGSSRVRAMHRSAVLPVAPTVTQQQQGLWVRSCPLPRQPVGCSVLGMGGKAGKTDSLCVGDGQIRAERRARCSCPHCSFGQCNWGQGVQFTTCQPFGAVNRAICIFAFYFFPLSK